MSALYDSTVLRPLKTDLVFAPHQVTLYGWEGATAVVGENNGSSLTPAGFESHVTTTPLLRSQTHETGAYVFFAGLALWVYLLFVVLAPKPRCSCRERLDGKTVVITGGTDGVGKETALELAKRGARIILPCRNIQKGHKVISEIQRATGNFQLSVFYVDFTILESVEACAKQIVQAVPNIDVLINSAGIGHGIGSTRDGFPMLFGVNHLGPFHFTKQLLAPLRKAGNARVIFVSSIAHLWGEIDFDSLQEPDTFTVKSQFKAYSRSKLANVLVAKQLHRTEGKHGITTYVAHPGWTFTSLFRDFPLFIKFLAFPLFHLFLYLPKEGAQTQIHLALARDLECQSGGYFVSCRQAESCQNAEDFRLAADLWAYSEKAVASALSYDVQTCTSI